MKNSDYLIGRGEALVEVVQMLNGKSMYEAGRILDKMIRDTTAQIEALQRPHK
jgi:hypothetical protein